MGSMKGYDPNMGLPNSQVPNSGYTPSGGPIHSVGTGMHPSGGSHMIPSYKPAKHGTFDGKTANRKPTENESEISSGLPLV